MRLLTALLLIASVLCVAFAYWGLKTTAGRAAFDEMAGMIPLGVGVLGIVFALGALVLWWLSRGN